MTISDDRIDDIRSKLNIIIEKEIISYIKDYSLSSGNISYETGDMLINFLGMLSIDKEELDFAIRKMFFNYSVPWDSLLFYVSFRYGLLDKYIEYFNYSNINIETASNFNNHFYEIIPYFSEKQLQAYLNRLRNLMGQIEGLGVKTKVEQLREKIVNYRFEGLKKELIGVNIEINKDKEEVKTIINYLGFNSKYNEFLTQLDTHFNSDKTSIEIAGLIGNFREFSTNIVLDIANEVAGLKGLDSIPEYKNRNTPIGHARSYLKEVFELTKHEDKFIDNFIEILNDEGGHAFLSSIEYFRLTKNIFIEIMLLLLSKLKDLKS